MTHAQRYLMPIRQIYSLDKKYTFVLLENDIISELRNCHVEEMLGYRTVNF